MIRLNQEQTDTIHEALDELAAQEKAAVKFRFWDQLTIEDIRKKLRVSWASTDQTLNRSLIKLRKVLTARLDEELIEEFENNRNRIKTSIEYRNLL